MSLKNFRAYQTAVLFFKACQKMSCTAHLKDQLVRASSSIALNLAEGSVKPTLKDQSKFYHQALGSLRESQAALELAGVAEDDSIHEIANKLGVQIFKLCEAIRPRTTKDKK
jgi:four helix bundle protein